MSDTESNFSEKHFPHDGLNDHRSRLNMRTPTHQRSRRGSNAIVDSDDDDEAPTSHSRLAPRATTRPSSRGLRRVSTGHRDPQFRENTHLGVHSNHGNFQPQRSRSHSVSEHIKSLIGLDLEKKSSRQGDSAPSQRRPLVASIDLDAASYASTSQETDEDVCYPMTKDQKEHVLVNGIDFERIDAFVLEERREHAQFMKVPDYRHDAQASPNSVFKKPSKAAAKYLYKRFFSKPLHRDDPEFVEKLDSSSTNSQSLHQVKFGGAKITEEAGYTTTEGSNSLVAELPTRFSFFDTINEETVHAPDIPTLIGKKSASEVFNNGEPTWWLDCACPTDNEVKMLAKAFGIHPLTTEDIRMQETREKVELFKNYYFVSFHTFDPDQESEEFLEPVNFYIVVFGNGVLTFHFLPLPHSANVRRRVRQLRNHFEVNADWLCYALIDNITDSFAPIITNIEFEADAIEDYVFVEQDPDYRAMLQRIGESRRKVMTLMRLLSGKADVIKMFAKRCLDEAAMQLIHATCHDAEKSVPGISFGPGPGAHSDTLSGVHGQFHSNSPIAQPRADIAMYLGDIQDHVVTMFQNLRAYEKILSRSHANFLAQLQCTAVSSNNQITLMLSNVTIVGTMFLPLNFITGMFGMNVPVPGNDSGNHNFGWFFGIAGVMIVIVVLVFVIGKFWMGRSGKQSEPENSLGMRKFKMRRTRDDGAKSIISSNTKYD